MQKLTQSSEIEPFLSDASNLRGQASGVVYPENEKEVVEFLAESHAGRMPVTVSGYGTGLTGGRVPMGGWIMAMHRMNSMSFELNRNPGAPGKVRVEAGVQLKHLQSEALRAGLLYPSDPTSLLSFLGGNVATNASGSHAFKYGVTRNHVLRLRVVLANGDVLDLSRGMFKASAERKLTLPVIHSNGTSGILNLKLPDYTVPRIKHSAGYFVKPEVDAVDLFVGSEGTLGVVTEMDLNVIPAPEVILSFVVFFKNEQEAWHFADTAKEQSRIHRESRNDARIQARSFEYMDRASLELVREQYRDIPSDAQAAIYLEQECQSETQEMIRDQWSALFEAYPGAAENFWYGETPEDELRLRAFRHEIPLRIKSFLKETGQTKVGTDYAVPEKHFYEMLQYEKKRVKELGLYSVSFGHMADCHLHLNILPRNPEEHQLAWKLYEELIDKALSFGGTVAAEHGVGKLKTGFLEKMFGSQVIREMADLKRQLDPAGILGRGTLFEEKYLKGGL